MNDVKRKLSVLRLKPGDAVYIKEELISATVEKTRHCKEETCVFSRERYRHCEHVRLLLVQKHGNVAVRCVVCSTEISVVQRKEEEI